MKKGPFWGFLVSIFERSLVVAFIGLVITPLSLLAVGVTYQFQWGSFGAGNGQFNTPYSITTAPGSFLYAADVGNHRVQKFDEDGNFVDSFGSAGSGNGQFEFGPTDVTTDEDGNVYATDYGSGRVQKFDEDGNFITKWGSEGSGNGEFDSMFGIDYHEGEVYVADRNNGRVQVFDTSGNYLDQFGQDSEDPGGILEYPISAFVSDSGRVYVLDGISNRVVVYDENYEFLFSWGESGTGPGQFQAPTDLSIDSSGNIYVNDAVNHRIQVFNIDGEYIFEFGGLGLGNGQFFIPGSLDITNDDKIFVIELGNNRVQAFEVDVPPAVLEVSSPTIDGYYNAGDVIAIDILFDEVITSSGSITVTFDSGGTCAIAQVVVATDTISCSYTILGGENSADLSVSSVGGTFLDSNLNEATDITPLVNLNQNSDLIVDTIAPNPPTVTSPEGPQTGDAILSLTGLAEPFADVVVVYEGVTLCIDTASDVGEWSCSFSPIEEYDTHIFSLTQEDQAGNISQVGTFSLTRATSGGGYVGGDDDDQEEDQNDQDNNDGSQEEETVPSEEFDFSEEQEFLPDGVDFTLDDIDPDGECFAFEEYLRQGNKGEEVTKIQKFMSFLGLYDSERIDGSFGPITDLSVRAFQSLKRETILEPWNLVNATGYWYKTTRGTANKMLGCGEGRIILENGNVVNF